MLSVWRVADRRASSILLYPEARAALATAARSRRLEPSQAAAATLLVDRLWAGVDRIDVTLSLAHRAGDLAELRALRGYDAVHLASAEALADPETVMVTDDGALRAAARAHGLNTAPD